MTTPRTDELLAANRFHLDHAFKLAAAYKALLEHAKELERELAEPLTILPPLPKKEILKAPERREILGYTAAQMMDYANAAVSAIWEQNH